MPWFTSICSVYQKLIVWTCLLIWVSKLFWELTHILLPSLDVGSCPWGDEERTSSKTYRKNSRWFAKESENFAGVVIVLCVLLFIILATSCNFTIYVTPCELYIQAVGYNSIEAEDWEVATSGEEMSKMEFLLLDKNRKMEHELTQLKVWMWFIKQWDIQSSCPYK